jgi:hypothetical protein
MAEGEQHFARIGSKPWHIGSEAARVSISVLRFRVKVSIGRVVGFPGEWFSHSI